MTKKLTKRCIASALTGGILTLAAALTPAAAAELTEFTLDDVVVTAARVETRLSETPANVSVVTAEMIEERNYQSVKEALDDVAGTTVISNGFIGSEQHVFLNGEDRVLFLVNGRRVNLDRGGGHGRQSFDLRSLPSTEAIERIEVVKGASTSLYGSDAVGGVINVITKRGAKPYSTVDIGVGSWGTRKYSAATSGSTDKGFGYYVSLGKDEQDYIRFKNSDTGSNTKWENTKSDGTNASVRLDQQIGEDQLLTLTFDHSFRDSGQPYQAPGNAGYYTKAKATILDNNLMLKYDWGLDGADKGYLQLFRNHNVGVSYNNDGTRSEYTEEKDGLALQQSMRLAADNVLTVGFDWNSSDMNNSSAFTGEKNIDTKALYLSDAWKLGDGWQLSAGGRYDKHNYFGHKTTGSAAVNKEFKDGSNAYISYNQVFNAPQGNDLFYDSPWSYGNPNLKPETGHVMSIGYNIKASSSTDIGINYYRSKLKNAIDWAPDPASLTGAWSVYNIGHQKKDGVELTAKHVFSDQWSVWGSYAYANVENSNDGSVYKWDNTVRPNNYKVGVRYAQDAWNVELIGRGATGLSRAQYENNEYFVFDLAAQYKVTSDLKAYLKLYNLNNQSYAEKEGVSASGATLYPAAGRSVFLGMEYKF